MTVRVPSSGGRGPTCRICHPLLLCSGVRGWSCSNAITCLWQHDDSNQAELQFALGYMPVVDSCIYSMGDVWRSWEIFSPSPQPSGLPFRASCCWNGLAVLRAAPLLHSGVKFRSHQTGECHASECTLLCDDYARLGYTNVVIDGGVQLAYDYSLAREMAACAAAAQPHLTAHRHAHTHA